jgi:hypothetical protein
MALDIEKQFAEILKEYDKELKDDIEKALTKASQIVVDRLKAASPVGDDAPHFKDQWGLKTKYTGVRYIGNSKEVQSKSGNIPLINLLEYGPYAKPFVARTFEANKEIVFNTFVQTLKGGK